MGLIKALDEAVVNKIAAGEIIIAPANALKELLENAIDAGSSNIQVSVKNGGLKTMQITDNGSGIMKDDLPILCHRFTTSKLKTFEDLNNIATFGFRGEALSSISHIAHLTVTTKTKDDQCAWKCKYSQGELYGGISPIAGKTGTQLIVEDLFYNFTSRLKSIKSANEEFIKILDVVNKYSINTKGVGFSVKKIGESHNSLTIREAQDAKERIRTVYGSNVANSLIPMNIEENGEIGLSAVTGQISNLNYNTNRKRTHAIFFINNRLVDCEPLKRAIVNIYSVYLPKGCKPFIYLNLGIKPGNLDVNIHPTKKEVRFLHEDEIINHICEKLQAELDKIDDARLFKTEKLLNNNNNTRSITEEIYPPKKRQKINLNQSLSQSFSLGSQRPHESKLVRVDGTQTKITSFLQPEINKFKNGDTTLQTEDSAFENSVISLEPNDDSLPSVDKENFSFIANERVPVTLASIINLRNKVENSVNKELTKVFSNFVFVGIVQYSTRTLTFQSDISLFLLDYGKLFYQLFYQIGLSDFGNFGKIFLKNEVSIKKCARFVFEKITKEEDYHVEKINKIVDEKIDEIVEMKDMFEEYFGIIMDITDLKDPKIVSIPLLLKSYLPSMNKLVLFIYKLLFKINFNDEEECLDGILKEVALFYIPESVEEYDNVENGKESEEMNKYKKNIESLLEVTRRRFLATSDLSDSLIEIANLPSLYKCFERC